MSPEFRRPLSRGSLLAALLTAMLLIAVVWAAGSRDGFESTVPTRTSAEADVVAFFVIGDTHLLANKANPATLQDRSEQISAGLVETLNNLPGAAISKSAGGGKVLVPRGVIHAGDCIDTGHLAKLDAQKTEWSAFSRFYGLTGKDGLLRFPIYEVHGNHDGPSGETWPVSQIIERNRSRPGVTHRSKTGLHYSWDWGKVHFVNLGIVVGQVDDVKRRRRYPPHGSLEFLIADLKEKVGDSGRPVVITHHVDMLRYAQRLPVEDSVAVKLEWDPADVRAYHEAIKDYNVVAILYGHTHGRAVYKWNGTNRTASEGISVFNVTKSAHYSTPQQGFFYIEIDNGSIVAREYQTRDGWTTGFWTPQVWSAPIGSKRAN